LELHPASDAREGRFFYVMSIITGAVKPPFVAHACYNRSMDKDAHEQYELEEALVEAWCNLQEAHLVLEGERSDSRFYAERLAEVIGRLQAYGRVLRKLEKRTAHKP
jgi:hypothetical protein